MKKIKAFCKANPSVELGTLYNGNLYHRGRIVKPSEDYITKEVDVNSMMVYTGANGPEVIPSEEAIEVEIIEKSDTIAYVKNTDDSLCIALLYKVRILMEDLLYIEDCIEEPEDALKPVENGFKKCWIIYAIQSVE